MRTVKIPIGKISARSILFLFLSVMLTAMLTGCNLGGTVDSLLEPPMLSEDEALVYNALIRAAGNDIVLKYPKSGQFRSAVNITDIDGDNSAEAVAFYERKDSTDADGSLRVNILDKDTEGRWYSVYDHAGAGNDIDRMIVSTLGSSETPLLSIGFIMFSGSKTARIYSYADNRLSGEFSDNYTNMFTADIDRNGQNELCLIHPNTPERQAYLSLISIDGSYIYEWGNADLNPDASDFSNIASGQLSPDTAALYIDSTDGEYLRTDIVYAPSQGRLRNPMYLDGSMLTDKTLRPAGYLTADIDKDGTLEVPTVSLFPGYSDVNMSQTDEVYAVNWNILTNFTIQKKYTSYYSTAEGFCFLFPQRWDSVVTVRTDSRTGDIVFCKYVSGVRLEEMPELLRVAVVEKSTAAGSKSDYKRVVSRDNFDYLIKSLKTADEPLILTDTEIVNNFYLLG